MSIAAVGKSDAQQSCHGAQRGSTGTIVSRHERRISAPAGRIWQLHADVVRWPRWQRDIKDARLDGQLKPGVTFRWWTAGMERSRSTVYAVQPGRRTLWSNPAAGIQGIHEWRLEAVGSDMTVVTVESWAGVPDNQDPEAFADDHGHAFTRWLDFMEYAAIH